MGKIGQIPIQATVSMHNPSINIVLHIIAVEGYFKIITSLNMHTTV